MKQKQDFADTEYTLVVAKCGGGVGEGRIESLGSADINYYKHNR